MKLIFIHNSIPFERRKKDIFIKASILLGFATLFMFYFYLRRWYPDNLIVILPAIGYGLVVSGTYLMHSIISPKVYKSFFDSETWNIKKEILFGASHFILIYITIIIYSLSMGFIHVSPFEFVRILLIVVLVGLLPALLFFVFNLFRHSQTELEIVESINQKLRETTSVDSEKTIQIEIPLRTGTETITLNNFLYSESEGNYINLHYKNQETKKIRSTLTQFENSCAAFSNILRVHRAFILNIDAVSEIKGNSSGYQVQLHHTDQIIPISRTYVAKFRDQFE